MIRLATVLWVCVIVCGFTQVTPAAAQQANAYTLGAGDKLHVIVFGENDLTGDYVVDDGGFVALPLIGQVHVGGSTIDQAQQVITQRYGANYLVNPRVSVAVINYRPFFILGEVKNPGSYPYVGGMTVLNAVALAGGYTPRGDPDDILVKHANNTSGAGSSIKEGDPVEPGDIIRVRQKLF